LAREIGRGGVRSAERKVLGLLRASDSKATRTFRSSAPCVPVR